MCDFRDESKRNKKLVLAWLSFWSQRPSGVTHSDGPAVLGACNTDTADCNPDRDVCTCLRCSVFVLPRIRGWKCKIIPLQTLRVPGGRGCQISRKAAHEGGKVVSPTHRPPLLPRKYSWYSFLLDAESSWRPQCGRKDDVNEKFHWHHRESIPRPLVLQPTASSCASPQPPYTQGHAKWKVIRSFRTVSRTNRRAWAAELGQGRQTVAVLLSHVEKCLFFKGAIYCLAN